MPSGKRARQQRREAAARTPPPVRSKGASRPSRRALVIGGVVLVVLIGLGIGLGVAFSGGGHSSSTSGSSVDFSHLPGLQTEPPPWDNGAANLSDKLPIVHLQALTAEGAVLHIHQHLDIYLNGQHLTVPEGIGIDDNSFLTEIHTHDTTGLIHVESPTQKTFRLGQFFGEWGVRVSPTCLGSYCGHLRWWVDGKPQTGDPADLPLREHQEIVIAVGRPPAHIPSTYQFKAGE